MHTCSSLWGSTRTDENGRIIEEYMDEHNLVCLNDGRGTRFDVGRGTESAIDLTSVRTNSKEKSMGGF